MAKPSSRGFTFSQLGFFIQGKSNAETRNPFCQFSRGNQMIRFKVTILFTSCLLLALTAVYCKVTTANSGREIRSEAELRDHDASISRDTAIAFKSVELLRRNWENHGTDTRIYGDGSFTVNAVFLGESKKVREGMLSKDQLKVLSRLIDAANIFELADVYEAPFKTPLKWWGYQLTFKTDKGTKTVRFHSEDDSVPPILIEIVEEIMTSAK